MAPRKKTVVEPSTRVTRSSAKLATKPTPEIPKKNKAKAAPENPKNKKAKSTPSEPKLDEEKPEEEKPEEEKPEETNADAAAEGSSTKKKTIIVEYCKQCNSFKTRALQVKAGLEKGLEGEINVVLNPEKPRKGCFEIREEGENGEKFITLLEMKRPFKPMKDLDMDQVVSDILEKVKD